MFERLDPPSPFEPDAGFREAVLARGRRIRRRRHRVAGAAVGSVVVLVGVVGVAAGWADRRWDEVQRVEVGQLPEKVDALSGDPFNVLLVGTDGGGRTDSIMVVRISPDAHRVQVVSIPRDLWVPIAGGEESRINNALAVGGASALVGTVESALGIPVDRYIEVDPEGFRELVDAAGGVRLSVKFPLRARSTGLDVTAGCHRFDGTHALALVRARNLEIFINGRWVMDPSGDFGRLLHQQEFGRAVVSSLGDLGSDPIDRARLLDVFAEHVTMDSRWTREQLESLQQFAAGVGHDDVSSRIFPTVDAVRGGANVLLPGGEALPAVTASLRGEAPDPRPGAAETTQHGPDVGPC